MRTRYTITRLTRPGGSRIIALANQADAHYDTKEEAEAYLAAVRQDRRSLEVVLGKQLIDTLRVDPITCYDNGDAVSIYITKEPS